jgi:hypothetical protein
MRHILLFFALSLGPIIKGQSITKVWEYDLSKPGETLIDWVRTRDNRIAMLVKSGDISHFRLLDIERVKQPSVRQTTRFDSGEQPYGITAIDDDGSYFVVGQQNNDAWSIRLDEKGHRDAKSEYTNKEKGVSFEKAIWFSYGGGIIAGRRNQKSILYKVRFGDYKSVSPLHSNLADVDRFQLVRKPYTDDEFWLVEQSKKGVQAFCYKSDEPYHSNPKLGYGKNDVILADAVPVFDEGIMAVGMQGNRFPWCVKDTVKNTIPDFSLDFGEFVNAAAPVGALGAWLTVICGQQNNKTIYRLIRYDDDFKASDTTCLDLVHPDGNLSDVRLLAMDTDFFVFGGTLINWPFASERFGNVKRMTVVQNILNNCIDYPVDKMHHTLSIR